MTDTDERPPNPHFLSVPSWEAAAEEVTFEPRRPRLPELAEPSLSILVMDHRKRVLPAGRRSLEAHFHGFVLSQTRCGKAEAAKRALRVRYGIAPQRAEVAGHEGRSYELGEATWPPDDDGPSPAVLTWHDGEMHFFLASVSLRVDALARIADSMYR